MARTTRLIPNVPLKVETDPTTQPGHVGASIKATDRHGRYKACLQYAKMEQKLMGPLEVWEPSAMEFTAKKEEPMAICMAE